MEGNLFIYLFFTVFAWFYFVFEGNFRIQNGGGGGGGLYLDGRFKGGFLHYEFGGLIFGGAYTWRGLFSEFYGITFTAVYPRLEIKKILRSPFGTNWRNIVTSLYYLNDTAHNMA